MLKTSAKTGELAGTLMLTAHVFLNVLNSELHHSYSVGCGLSLVIHSGHNNYLHVGETMQEIKEYHQ